MYTLLILLLLESIQAAVFCNKSQKCPEELPCCSEDGQCGTGLYCVDGCNPIYSFHRESCMPMPICKDFRTDFKNYASRIGKKEEYLGDASETDWLYKGYIADYDDDGAVVVALPKDSYGTVLSTTRSVWYGKVRTTLKTSHGAGVVTAIFLLSGVQDEIDYEIIGNDLNNVHTKFFYHGELNRDNAQRIPTSDTYENYHTYELDWQEDRIVWSVDGASRVLFKNETWDNERKIYRYPQTPSRISIALWPAGSSENQPGTIEWGGGPIDWNAPEFGDPGYLHLSVKDFEVKCYDPPASAIKNGTKSYKYISDDDWTQNGIAIVDDDTVLDSANGRGTIHTGGASSSDPSKSNNGMGSLELSQRPECLTSSCSGGGGAGSTPGTNTSSNANAGFVPTPKSLGSLGTILTFLLFQLI